MTYQDIQHWVEMNPDIASWVLGATMLTAGIVLYLIVRFLVARSLFYLASRTANKYDDIIVDKRRPYRFAWLAPCW